MDVVWTLRQAAYAVLSVMLPLLEKVRERGELPRVEWQANDHLLRMRAGARVAASRRHEPDRSEVQSPAVAISTVSCLALLEFEPKQPGPGRTVRIV